MTFRQPGLAVSLALHATLFVPIVLFVRPVVPLEAVEDVISVELVTLPPPAAVMPVDPVLTSPNAQEQEAVAPPQTADPDLIRPTRMLAASVLAEPGNEAALKAFDQIDPGLVREQLCGIEAVEQIAAHYPELRPEAVVASAFAKAHVREGALIAEEAAFMVGTDWYRMRFECTMTSGDYAVADFAFAIGEFIPPEEALRHDLAFWPIE